MLHTLTKGWYRCCYKYRCRNLNLYPNIYFRESSFLFRGNSTTHFNRKKNEQTKQDSNFDESNKKSGNDYYDCK